MLLKALGHEPEIRYPSAGELANDIDNYLSGEPLSARAPTTIYFLRKRLSKYRIQVLIASVILLALIGTAVFAYVRISLAQQNAIRAAQKTSTQRDLARAEAQRAVLAEEEASNQRDIARAEARRALKAERAIAAQRDIAQAEARKARAAEKEASRQRDIALAQTARADREDQRATREARQADLARKQRLAAVSKADMEEYVNLLGQVQLMLEKNQLGSARRLLDTAPLSVRGWEWGFLRRKAQPFDRSMSIYSEGRLRSQSISRDRRLLAACGRRGRVSVWDTTTGKQVHALQSGQYTEFVVISPDGRFLAVIERETAGLTGRKSVGRVSVWNVQTGKKLHSCGREFSVMLYAAAFTPNGQTLAVGENNHIRFFDANTGRSAGEISAGAKSGHLVYSASGKRLAATVLITSRTTVSKRRLRVWNMEASPPVLIPTPNDIEIDELIFSSDERTILSTRRRFSRVDLKTGKSLPKLKFLDGRSFYVIALDCSPDGKLLAASLGRQAVLWDSKTGKQLREFRGHSGGVRHVWFRPDGRSLLTADGEGTVCVWDIQTYRDKVSITAPKGKGFACAALSPDGASVITGGTDGVVSIWDANSGRKLRDLSKRGAKPRSVGFSPDGTFATCAGRNKYVSIYDPTGARQTVSFQTSMFSSVAVSPDGRRMAVSAAGPGYGVRIVDSQTGKEFLSNPERGYFDLAFSPDGLRLAGIDSEGGGALFDAKNLKIIADLTDKANFGTRSVAFSPDGKLLATGSGTAGVQIWDAQTGRKLMLIIGPERGSSILAFSPDGRRILASSPKSFKGATVWDTQTGKHLVTLFTESDKLGRAQFSADGRRLLTSVNGETLEIHRIADWSLAPTTRPVGKGRGPATKATTRPGVRSAGE